MTKQSDRTVDLGDALRDFDDTLADARADLIAIVLDQAAAFSDFKAALTSCPDLRPEERDEFTDLADLIEARVAAENRRILTMLRPVH